MFYLSVFRDILELTEAVKVKDAEAEAYISEHGKIKHVSTD